MRVRRPEARPSAAPARAAAKRPSTPSTELRSEPPADPSADLRAERPPSANRSFRPELLSLGALLERLETAKGRALREALASELGPAVAGVGLIEPGAVPEARLAGLPRFHRAVLEHAAQRFERSGDLERSLPAILAATFARFAGPGGALDRAALRAALGPEAALFVDRLAAADGSVPALADRLVFDRLDPETAKVAIGSSSIAPPKMAALDWVKAAIAEPGELEGLSFYGLQHLFLSSASLFQAIEDLGVKPKDMVLQGKIYSTNHGTAAWLEQRGAKVADTSRTLPPGRLDFEAEMKDSILHDLSGIVATLPRPPEPNPDPRVLLIDDGGKAIALLHEHFPEYAPYFVCVEQTRRGARAVKALPELRCPVVNVAESWAKLTAESPMIGHSVVLEVGRKLTELEAAGVELGSSAGVLGYGAVGAAVTDALLERGFTVHVHDPDQERRAAALADAVGRPGRVVVHESIETALPESRTLVSCVGQRTLWPEHHHLLPDGAVLVNAASSDDELGPEDLRPFASGNVARDGEGRIFARFQGKVVCLGHGEALAHSSTVTRLPNGRDLLLANNGYVVNMTGERDPIPPRYIQLTRALLLLGAIAARRTKAPGLHEVPKDWQEKLVRVVKDDLHKTGESLERPDWERREPAPLPPPVVAPASVRAALGLDGPASFPEGTVFGYQLGPVRPGSVEDAAHRQFGDGSGTLSLPEAVLHRLTHDLHSFFRGSHFRLELDHGAPVPAGEPGPAAFSHLYGTYLGAVLGTWAERRGHQPHAPEVVTQLVRLLEERPLDSPAVLRALQTHPDPGLRRLGQAAYRRLSHGFADASKPGADLRNPRPRPADTQR